MSSLYLYLRRQDRNVGKRLTTHTTTHESHTDYATLGTSCRRDDFKTRAGLRHETHLIPKGARGQPARYVPPRLKHWAAPRARAGLARAAQDPASKRLEGTRRAQPPAIERRIAIRQDGGPSRPSLPCSTAPGISRRRGLMRKRRLTRYTHTAVAMRISGQKPDSFKRHRNATCTRARNRRGLWGLPKRRTCCTIFSSSHLLRA